MSGTAHADGQGGLSQGAAPSEPSSSIRPQRDELTPNIVDADATTPLLTRPGQSPPPIRRRKRSSYCLLLLPLLLISVLLGLFSDCMSWYSQPPSHHPSALASSLLPEAQLSNGTHAFRRTVILISLDGAKPAYLRAGLFPNLTHPISSSSFSRDEGYRQASYMQPIFPTLTFPNHWALLTGLHASSHGIVANDFTLSSTHRQFYYTNPAQSWNSSWWLGEPIWATAQRSGLKSAVLMWPGPPVTSAGDAPSYFQKYESGPEWGLEGRLKQVLKWIDIEGGVEERPSLICAYVPDIDQAAHRFGPHSREAVAAVKRVDAFLGQLRRELVEERRLGGVVDVVVVSDHGMTETSNHKLIFLDTVLGRELYEMVESRDAWPLAGLRLRGRTEREREESARRAYVILAAAAKKRNAGFNVYRREELPERFHLQSSVVEDRLAPLWMIPRLGWSITTHHEMATFADGIYAPIGNHGYDNEEEDMHAIFVASGPSFTPLAEEKKGRRKGGWNMDGFKNVEVHNLVSRILGVPEGKRAATNGTWSFWDSHLRHGL
ncbi:related to nucleotide diphosphatase [Ustilago bromivora]|uniref:Related to nucleotide diphosphatase n=1 Tax=Ustilago bromivora TaxID=307758 RepID=A0A1K0G342_9BASI|nr:related to nucleotide diphosphatase [Ustilago bromivora]SYW81034.1 related to nucleotide diphosphatase [Ustilago bromivora]